MKSEAFFVDAKRMCLIKRFGMLPPLLKISAATVCIRERIFRLQALTAAGINRRERLNQQRPFGVNIKQVAMRHIEVQQYVIVMADGPARHEGNTGDHRDAAEFKVRKLLIPH